MTETENAVQDATIQPPLPPVAPPASQTVIVQTPVFVRPEKNMMLALLLTFFLGSLGMLYATIPGGIILTLIGGPLLFFTGGVAGVVIWPIQLIWTYLAVKNYNAQGRRQVQQALR